MTDPLRALFRALFKLFGSTVGQGPRSRPGPDPVVVPVPVDPPAPPSLPLPTGDPLALRGDWLTFRYQGRITYLGDNPAEDGSCAAYRAKGYTDILVASNLGPQPGADAPFDLFGDPEAYAARCAGFQSRGIRAIGQIGFEDNWGVWATYAGAFDAHLTALVRAADPHVSSWLFGVEWDEGIAHHPPFYDWDETLGWIERVAANTARPILVHFRQTAWGPEGDTPWQGSTSGRQLSWWKELRRRLPNHPLGCAFQHRHDRPQDKRANGAFLTASDDIVDHVGALTAPTRLGGIGVTLISFEYAFNGRDNDAFVVLEEEAARAGDLALSQGAYGAMNGVTLDPRP